MRHRTLITALAGAALLPALAAPAFGSPASHAGGENGNGSYRAHLAPVPHDPAADSGSNVTADAHIVARNGELKVRLDATGLSPNLPHLAHIHGQEQFENECPGFDRAAGGIDPRLIETLDGVADYGPIRVTFSTSGDTSPAAGLSLGTAPVADAAGNLHYRRDISVPAALQQDLETLHIVIHGEDLDDNGVYGGPITGLGAPIEAELPVACGEIHR